MVAWWRCANRIRAATFSRSLPEALSAVVDEVVNAGGALSARDIGPVMKQCMARFAGKLVDGKKVNLLVKARLGKAP